MLLYSAKIGYNIIMTLYPDNRELNADWTKQRWNLPPYKSDDFNSSLENSGLTLAQYRNLPVYISAVKRGLIVNDEWVGKADGYE